MEETSYKMVNVTFIMNLLSGYCNACVDPECGNCQIKMILDYLKDPGVSMEKNGGEDNG